MAGGSYDADDNFIGRVGAVTKVTKLLQLNIPGKNKISECYLSQTPESGFSARDNMKNIFFLETFNGKSFVTFVTDFTGRSRQHKRWP